MDRINEELLWKQVKNTVPVHGEVLMCLIMSNVLLKVFYTILLSYIGPRQSLVEHIRAVESSSCPTRTILFGLLMTQ